MTADRAVRVVFTGRSYGEDPNIVAVSGQCSHHPDTNSIRVMEAGTVMTKVQEKPEVVKEGRLMYDGMSAVLSASQPLLDVSLYEVRRVCGSSLSHMFRVR